MIEIYKNNSEMLKAMRLDTKKLFSPCLNIVDFGSDKPTRFGRYLARTYGGAQIIHFKDIQTIGRVPKTDGRGNLNYAFKRHELKEGFFDAATAFFSLHEFGNSAPGYERTGQLELMYQTLKSGQQAMIIDYNLVGWVRKTGMSEEQFVEEVFFEKNEREVMEKEKDCMLKHTAYGLEQCIEEAKGVGFTPVSSKLYHINTPLFGIQPKLFLAFFRKN